MRQETFVILGNGIAGLSAAMSIREENKDSKVILIGDESYYSYSRPMITKAPLRGFDISKFIIKEESWYRENNIVNILGKKAINICKDSKVITCDDGERISYDKCIIATGAESFVPPISGVDKKGVFVARKIDDISKIRMYKLKSKNAVVIGGGVIGLEAAWELKKSGLNVVVLEQSENLMGRLLDSQSADVLKNIVTSQGIEVVNNIQIEELYGEGKVEKVILKNGVEYDADLVVLSCGIKPNVEIAKGAGVDTNRSIVVNEKMETSIKDIYACGDCAEYNGINLGLWEQAVKQGEVAGKNACGYKAYYEQIKTNLIFNGIKTSLYTIGDIGKNIDINYKEIVIEKKGQESKYFMVNNPMQLDYSYQKYYFDEEKIVGGVLIGDLSNMILLKNSIEEKLTYNEFKVLLSEDLKEEEKIYE